MSIVKIQGVKRLDNAINYITQDHKTNNDLISTFDCDLHFIKEDFENLFEERNRVRNTDTKQKSKMIIQSFGEDDLVTPEEAHQIGKELADNYLEGKHQYIIATHTDGNHIHNHIIFNEVRTDNLLMFDTTRRNTIDNLRLKNDELSRKYNLFIPAERDHEKKIHYINQRELRARKKGISFKEELETTIDEVVKIAVDYQDFINIMENIGFKSKQGKHLSFKNEDRNYFMRTKTLGMNYTENSIKYRIENKDFEIHKFKYILETEKIDKSQEKFKNNYGLRKWATKKNIAHLQEISHLIFNEKLSLDEIEDIKKSEEEFTLDIAKKIEEKDNLISDLQKKEGAFQDYKDSAGLMVALKNSKNKREFKSKNYKEIIKHDIAKKNITELKNKYGIHDLEGLYSLKNKLEEERNIIYSQYTEMQRDRQKEREKEIEKKDKVKKDIVKKNIRRL